MCSKFSDKVVIVTGASSGIGRVTALEFAKEGAKVALAARRQEECEKTVAEIKDSGGEAIALKVDVTQPEDVEKMVAETISTFGKLDCAFNNAGIAGDTKLLTHEHSLENWEKVMTVNLTSIFLCMKYQIPAMLDGGKGTIVNNSSIYGKVAANIGHVPYAASKYGVVGLTQTAAYEYAQKGIRVNAVCPGFTWTELMEETYDGNQEHFKKNILPHIPMGRFGKMEEVARLVLWLASDEAGYVTGQAVGVDGGWMAI